MFCALQQAEITFIAFLKNGECHMYFDEHFIQGALSDFTIINNNFPNDARFSIDSRTLQKGEIFVALVGKKTDGHDFIKHALDNGAVGLIIAKEKKDILKKVEHAIKDKLVVAVPDPLKALLRLAKVWRSQFNYPVVAITGSVGKTSTKMLLANIVSLQYKKFLVSRGNENTQLGVALNMLKMRPDHSVAIFEVGISKRGEMAIIANMLQPTSAVITCVGHSHMEGLGSLGDIALEKRDIFKYFTEESVGIINGDQPLLASVGYIHPVIKFGSKTINQIQARKIIKKDGNIQFVLKLYKKKYTITLKQSHEGAVFNCLAAAAAAHFLSISHEDIIRGLSLPLTISNRFESLQLAICDGTIISDCYNANPESMKYALLAFDNMNASGKKIAVLGDMLELGVNSPFWHRQLGRFLRKTPSVSHVILVGDFVKWTHKTIPVGLSCEIVPNWQEAAKRLEKQVDKSSIVLVKGSCAMGLTNLVKQVT